jgi:hypothetical protein
MGIRAIERRGASKSGRAASPLVASCHASRLPDPTRLDRQRRGASDIPLQYLRATVERRAGSASVSYLPKGPSRLPRMRSEGNDASTRESGRPGPAVRVLSRPHKMSAHLPRRAPQSRRAGGRATEGKPFGSIHRS